MLEDKTARISQCERLCYRLPLRSNEMEYC